MKSLLQSKRFRKNLYRWLGMYIGVILLFASVITYSKYMIGFSGKDNARVAKFNIDVNYNETSGCKPGTTETTCLVGKYRPTSKIPYYFTVNTKKIEVRTLFALTINVDSNFEIIELAQLDIGKNETEFKPVDLTDKKEENKIILTNTTAPNSGSEIKYRITVRYKGANILIDSEGNPYYEYNTDNIETIGKIVTVDYSAEQLTS